MKKNILIGTGQKTWLCAELPEAPKQALLKLVDGLLNRDVPELGGVRYAHLYIGHNDIGSTFVVRVVYAKVTVSATEVFMLPDVLEGDMGILPDWRCMADCRKKEHRYVIRESMVYSMAHWELKDKEPESVGAEWG